MSFDFEKAFRSISYAAVCCGFAALWVSGTFGIAETALFAGVVAAAWFLEGLRWQISEKLGTALIVLALPAFYLAWKYQLLTPTGGETWIAGILARMILVLASIKLLQKKSDRDWIFLYLMSFFEVLLAAGLSISILYFVSFVFYLLVMVCAVIAFEMRKTARSVEVKISGKDAKGGDARAGGVPGPAFRKLPGAAFVLIALIIAVAMPLFFMLPRVGGAGFGGSQTGLSTASGFSDTVRLGGIGRIQQNDEVAMRVKFEGKAPPPDEMYFRGVALDTFDNRSWSKAKSGPREPFIRGDRDIIQVDVPAGRDSIVVQTVYLEPMETPVLFGIPRMVAVRGGFPAVYRDAYGAITYQRTFERVSYKALSDATQPPESELRSDDSPYTADLQNYRSLPPVFDHRIAELASKAVGSAKNRYDKAKAVEAFLRDNFAYTLEQKAAGDQPLSDFLFNVKEGHCEYFATAMALMLRTQGLATRIVNGFHGGDYNDAADMTVVRQRNAHAWVEVFFPKESVWITFDPTPASGTSGTVDAPGIAGTFNKYLEAFEAFWIQYFVAFDDQEQRTLARSLRENVSSYSSSISAYLQHAQALFSEWWRDVSGERGLKATAGAVGYAAAYLAAAAAVFFLSALAIRRFFRSKFWNVLRRGFSAGDRPSKIEFYTRLQVLLSKKGFVRQDFQTPLEFAVSVGIPAAALITEKYHQVRFGGRPLTRAEAEQIDGWLDELDSAD